MEWYVPFIDDHAMIYHGHTDPDDHSECGPQIFCCPKAALLLQQRHPSAIRATAEWLFTEGKHLVSWMQGDGPRVFYFFFCDPEERTLLRFCGVRFPDAREVLLKRRSLDLYLESADRILPPSSKRAV
jgi:hypothetical protein